LCPSSHHLISCFQQPAITQIYTLSLHDALPISVEIEAMRLALRHKEDLAHLGTIQDSITLQQGVSFGAVWTVYQVARRLGIAKADRKSTRLNSSHGSISYAVFCLKKKKNKGQAH